MTTKQGEEKSAKGRKKDSTDHEESKTTTHGSKANRLQNTKGKHTAVSGKRRQYLTEHSQQTFVTEQSSPSATQHPSELLRDNAVSRDQNGVISLPPDINFMQGKTLSQNYLSQLMPVQLERPLPVPFLKPDIRLVPKLMPPVQYTKKPDVNVAHLHIEQGGI